MDGGRRNSRRPEPRVTLLVVDDDRSCLELVRATCEQDGLDVLEADDPEVGLELVRTRRPQIVLLDVMMPKLSGMELLDQINQIDPTIDVILITAHYSTESAVEAIQRGACDYLTKPLDVERLEERVGRLVAEWRRRRRASLLDEEALETYEFQGMVARSPIMMELFARILRVAPHFRTALITGPTGTGKELIARAMHALGPGQAGRLVVCNCAAIPESLVESELFGHVKGSFTGAVVDRQGLFEHAHGGTLFLDEIGDMPLSAQVKLLRAIQQQQVQRIGSPSARPVNVRIIAATNRDLRKAVADRQFREDLFFRLSMVELRVPALNDRREDLPLLIQHFIRTCSAHVGKPVEGLTRRAEMILLKHTWPGNVRELENVLSYACMIAHGTRVEPTDLPEYLVDSKAQDGGEELMPIDRMTRLYARRVVEKMGGDKIKAAAVLGVSRATVYRLLAGLKEQNPGSGANKR